MNEVVKFVIGSLVLDVMMIFSRTSMLRAPGASFWSNAEWMTHSKMATTARSLLVSEMTWAMAQSMLKLSPDW